VKKIRAKKAGHVFAAKENRPVLYEEIKEYFDLKVWFNPFRV
jgi:hypothetical protein